MTVWIIEPHDPLIFRDGRPFNSTPGASARSLPFPFPSTIAGGFRTQAGLDQNGVFQTSKTNIDYVKSISIKGPFLVELDGESKITNWLLPAPQDAMLLLEISPADKTNVKIKKLVPIDLPNEAFTDLDSCPTTLLLVGMLSPPTNPTKPYSQAPKFWYWCKLAEWLLEAKDIDELTVSQLGHNGPQEEIRTHVKIDPENQTANAKEGLLFQTRGLEFIHAKEGFSESKRLAIALETEVDITSGLAPLAGERRLVAWNKSSQEFPFPQLLPSIAEKISQTGACRVILLTPGYFENICNPTYLLKGTELIKPELKAVAVARPQVISGWDFAQNSAKPTRRLAPAGTVFFLKFEPQSDKEAIKKWVESIWLNSVSDDQQSRLDGFGIAILGTWSGKNEQMQMEVER